MESQFSCDNSISRRLAVKTSIKRDKRCLNSIADIAERFPPPPLPLAELRRGYR